MSLSESWNDTKAGVLEGVFGGVAGVMHAKISIDSTGASLDSGLAGNNISMGGPATGLGMNL